MKTRTEIMISRIDTTKTMSMLFSSIYIVARGTPKIQYLHTTAFPRIHSLEIVLKCIVSCGGYDPQLHRLERRRRTARARVSEQRTAAILEQAKLRIQLTRIQRIHRTQAPRNQGQGHQETQAHQVEPDPTLLGPTLQGLPNPVLLQAHAGPSRQDKL
uniref:Uncharacterized protein n=1 Tax=Aegilops tauschii subsp. strangulata TaxID=200361 RepID=A0A453GJK4_AEGTS